MSVTQKCDNNISDYLRGIRAGEMEGKYGFCALKDDMSLS